MATKSQIINESNLTYVPNTSGLITPQQVQTLNTDWINASIFPEDTGSMSVNFAATASFLLGSIASASYAVQADSASVAISSSYALTASYASNVPVTASYSVSSSYAVSSSRAITSLSSSYATSASLATRNLVTASASANVITFTKGDGTTFDVTVAQSGSVASASYASSALSASWANTAGTANSATTATSATSALTSISASFAISASQAISSSQSISSSFAVLAGNANLATTASYALTASYAPAYAPLSANNTWTGTNTFNNAATFNNPVTMSNVQINGTASIQYLNVVFESSSVIYASGSNILGDAANDTQTLWGTVNIISGPMVVTGSANFRNIITGSITGNAATATTANTASYVANAFISASQVGGNDKVSLTTAGGTTTTLTINNVASANNASTANTATSASYATSAGTATSASFASSATSASYATSAGSANSAASATSASYAFTASSAVNSLSASWASNAGMALTASYFNGLVASASYAVNAGTANNALTANVANSSLSATSASYALSASYLIGGAATLGANTFNGDQVISAGYELKTGLIQALSSAGLNFSSSANQSIARFGAGGGQQAEFFGQVSAVQFVGTGSGIVGVVTSSYALTASYYGGSVTSAQTASYVNNLNQSLIVTGSVRGNIVSQSIASSTASLNLDLGTFFDLTLAPSTTTHITATNVRAGETVSLRITQPATSGSANFGSTIKQVSGSAYTPTSANNAVDLVTLVAFDNTNLYLANAKNFI